MSLQNCPFVKISNEDETFYTFIKCLTENYSHLMKVKGMRAKKTLAPLAAGNKLRKNYLKYELSQGSYELIYEEHPIGIKVEYKDVLLTTECRMIEYFKELTVYGQNQVIIRKFMDEVFSHSNVAEKEGQITIYENNSGYWNVSKQKKPRMLESVVFEKQFVDGIIADIQEFVDSEEWYTEMGIPYKRSYLLFGPPGTGKSSLAQAIAAEIHFSICFVNCSDNINDFNFNKLLNTAPKQSIILVQDVDSIFSERKNVEKNNHLTFSGFLNAIDGVRSQEGRIIVMTTNFKERLDPALLRPGRIDEMYQIGLASKYQIYKLCLRFYKDQGLAKQFSDALPEGKFSMSMIQGFLLRHRKNPNRIMQKIEDLLQSDENIKIDQFLAEINCLECINDFKIQECYTLASAKNLPRTEIQKITAKLSPLLRGRLIENLRVDRKAYLRSYNELEKLIQELTESEQLQRELRFYCQQNRCNSIFQLKDRLREIKEKQEKKM